MNKLSDSLEFCPDCGANWQGDPIPEKSQELFGATHFSRKIGLSSLELDRTYAYKCPDCGKETKR